MAVDAQQIAESDQQISVTSARQGRNGAGARLEKPLLILAGGQPEAAGRAHDDRPRAGDGAPDARAWPRA